MSRSPYIPNPDGEFLAWVRAFANHIAAGPAVYGLSAADAALLVQLADEFEARLRAATTPTTRTAVTVAEKNRARTSATQVFRAFAQRIKHDDGVSDGDKIALGLHLRPRTLTRRRAPETSPLLRFIAATPGAHTLRYADSLTPNSRKRPPDAAGLQLFMAVSDDPVSDPGAARFIDQPTRSPFGVEHDVREAGRVATYFGRWIGSRGDCGPWSLPLHATILFGGGIRGRRRDGAGVGYLATAA